MLIAAPLRRIVAADPMLDAFKRLFASRSAAHDWRTVSGWARSQHYTFKTVKESQGFAIEGCFGQAPWRAEWGPPQRGYITSRELRLRMELSLPPDLQLMVISRTLQEVLEHQTFEDFTQGNQTYVGSAVPEEMRWLAMWPRAALSGHRELRQHFSALGVDAALAGSWVDGALGLQLLAARQALLQDSPAFIVMCNRGRLYLRMALPQPSSALLAEALAVFGVAAQQLLTVVGREQDAEDWPSTASSAWQSQMPEDHDLPR